MLMGVLKRVIGSLFRKKMPNAGQVAPILPTLEDLPVLLERAGAAHRGGQFNEALRHYQAALGLLPEAQAQAYAALLVNLGAVLRDLVLLPQAIFHYREAVKVQPGLAVAHYNLGLTLYETGEMEGAEASLRSAIELEPDLQPAHSTLLCLYGFARSEDPLRVLSEHRRWAEKFADPLTAKAQPHANDRTIERPLTIGYVSADFKEHSVARFISPILASHDRSRFRVICYDNWRGSDATTQRLHGHVDVWRKIDELNDTQVAQQVRADQVDILVDLSGHTTGNRLLMFALKPAPVQASWLGYMCTTGMSAIDWRITDSYIDQPGISENWYVERLAYITSAAAFEPHPDSPAVSSLPALTNGFVRFGSFNNYTKIGDEVIALWARVLAALPDSRLLLVVLGGDDPEIQAGVQARFEKLSTVRGVSHRIEVIGRRSIKEFLRLFHQVDIALDSFPYSGGTTSLHTLWMGVPVVAFEGNSELARGTSSMLISCGLDHLVARSQEQYLEIGTRLAKDLARLSDLRGTLRQRVSTIPVFDGLLVTQSLEAAYRRMWTDYVNAAKG